MSIAPSVRSFLSRLPALRDINDAATARRFGFVTPLVNDFTVSIDVAQSQLLKVSLHADTPVLSTHLQKLQYKLACEGDRMTEAYLQQLVSPGEYPYPEGAPPMRFGSSGLILFICIEGVWYLAVFVQNDPMASGLNPCVGACRTVTELGHLEKARDRETDEELSFARWVHGAALNTEFLQYYSLMMRGSRVESRAFKDKSLRALAEEATRQNLFLDWKLNADHVIPCEIAPNSPDEIMVSMDPFRDDLMPHTTERCFVSLNEDRAIEHTQIARSVSPFAMKETWMGDGEIYRERSGEFQLLKRAVVLIREDMVREAFLKYPNRPPLVWPEVVFDGFSMFRGAEVERWMAAHPHAQNMCPVLYKPLRRFFERDAANAFSIKRVGDQYRFRFKGIEFEVPAIAGMAMIAYVLLRPFSDFACAFLDAIEDGRGGASVDAQNLDLAAEGLQVTYGNAIRQKAESSIKHYESCLREQREMEKRLEQQIAEAEDSGLSDRAATLSARLSDLQDEMDITATQLKESRCRESGDRHDAINQLLDCHRKRWNRCIKIIAAKCKPFAEHLEQFLRHGIVYRYTPPPGVRFT